SRHFIKDVFDFADSIPYSVGKITPNGVDIYEKWHPELEKYFEGNYVLIHSSALRLFSVRTGDFDKHNTYSPRRANITNIPATPIRVRR
ncbi:MAG: hypothetical protein IH588_10135, partial [Anaerolineales bacterium]|nr:hypothetical protein [Anaerolineales bacterium]